jgi:hypothetical protein
LNTDGIANKTWEVREAELREQIAIEIEKFCREDTWDHKLCFCMVCAEIARGDYEEGI